MSEIKLGLMQKAIEEYEKIFPCGDTASLDDCFTQTQDKLFFWFNTEDNSTHIVEHSIDEAS
ncbi:hypothetical protein ACFL5S_00135 [Fibrobacterota bacterium]